MSSAGCPKHMTYGPCGGVRADGSCEVLPTPCVFLDTPTVPWPSDRDHGTPVHHRVDHAAEQPAPNLLALMQHRPVVISTLPARPLDAASISACAAPLRGAVDAVMLGDSHRARVQLPPAYRASLVAREGLATWPGLSCRDRNRVALEGELAALAHAGAAAVHCVTGDHTDAGHRPDAAPVFDLESTRLVPLARAAGLLTSVAASPASPPRERRAARLAEKVRAGAQVAFLQYCGGVDDVARFAEACRAEGVEVPLLPGLPVILDGQSAEVLATLPSVVLPPGYAQRVLRSSDPYQTGIEVALEHARELLQVPGVRGLQPASGPPAGAEVACAEALAVIGRALGAGAALPTAGARC